LAELLLRRNCVSELSTAGVTTRLIRQGKVQGNIEQVPGAHHHKD